MAFAICAATATEAVALPRDKALCLEAYESGQQLRAAGRLRAARERLIACAAPACPVAMQKECVGWLAEVDAKQPTVVPRAHVDGADVADVRVTVDGEERASRLDGAALEVDPGEHRFRFDRPGSPPVDRTVIVREGEKLRAVDADLAGPDAPPGRPFRWPEITLAAVGAAGLASFAVAGGLGSSRYGDLRSSCAPRCPEADVADVRTKLLVADVSLGLAIASLASAVLVHLIRPRAAPSGTANLAVVPAAGGAIGVAALRF